MNWSKFGVAIVLVEFGLFIISTPIWYPHIESLNGIDGIIKFAILVGILDALIALPVSLFIGLEQ